jgi:ATP-dependent exoDNAse (exonuclease V) alpha subunit
MVRADIFDGIDHTLRFARKDDRPFGGVQVCVIGDLFQLPPVVSTNEKTFYSQFYRSPFFFCTQAYDNAGFEPVQFNTIHRQNDAAFIQILNAIRAGTCDAIELEALNSRVIEKAAPAPGTLVLTTTNALAEDINAEKLARLSGSPQSYEGTLSGEFGMKGGRLPAPEQLVLKPGAQVMFAKNDSDGRWVNGTLGTVEKLAEETVSVRIGDAVHNVEQEKWQSIGYELDKETGKIIEKELGTYTQFPLMLAWAITIHKSQGKTLERVIIDLGNGAFAPGQLYVALSRCRSLSGIALKQPITHSDIRCDTEVVEFMRSMTQPSV